MTVNFEEAKELIGKRIAIHCDTEEKAEDLLKNLYEIGGEWSTGTKLTDMSEHDKCKERTCYNILRLSSITYGNKSSFMHSPEGFKVYKYEITEEEESEMTVNFEEVKELVGKRVAIYCDTKEEAEDLLTKLSELGGEWLTGNSLAKVSHWDWCEKDTCYVIDDIRFMTHSTRKRLKEKGYEIYRYEMEEEESGLKIHELVEGVEYKITNGGIIYRVVDGILESKFSSDVDEWRPTPSDYNFIMNAEFKEFEFKPKFNETYYYPSFSSEVLYGHYRWCGDKMDCDIKKNVGIYRTKEQAIKKAKELGWS